MADGYLFVEISPEGKAREIDHHFFDMDKREYVQWEDEEGMQTLVDLLPDSAVSDTHVFISFNHSSHTTYDSYNGEYDVEVYYEIEGFTVLQRDYKEFTRRQLTLHLASITGPSIVEYDPFPGNTAFIRDGVHDVVAEWEEFYDEDFKPFIPEPVKPVNANFLHLLQGGKD